MISGQGGTVRGGNLVALVRWAIFGNGERETSTRRMRALVLAYRNIATPEELWTAFTQQFSSLSTPAYLSTLRPLAVAFLKVSSTKA